MPKGEARASSCQGIDSRGAAADDDEGAAADDDEGAAADDDG
jgi:hypothetical protein